jgi:hypothetical protein
MGALTLFTTRETALNPMCLRYGLGCGSVANCWIQTSASVMQVCLSTTGEDISDVLYQSSSSRRPFCRCHDWHVTPGGGPTPRYVPTRCQWAGIRRPSTCVTATCLLWRGPTYGDNIPSGHSVRENLCFCWYVSLASPSSLSVMSWPHYDNKTYCRSDIAQHVLELNTLYSVRFEVFTAVTMKNGVFWDIKTQFILHRRHITSSLHRPAS